jgi:hypothetical protein
MAIRQCNRSLKLSFPVFKIHLTPLLAFVIVFVKIEYFYPTGVGAEIKLLLLTIHLSAT